MDAQDIDTASRKQAAGVLLIAKDTLRAFSCILHKQGIGSISTL